MLSNHLSQLSLGMRKWDPPRLISHARMPCEDDYYIALYYAYMHECYAKGQQVQARSGRKLVWFDRQIGINTDLERFRRSDSQRVTLLHVYEGYKKVLLQGGLLKRTPTECVCLARMIAS